MVFATDVSGHTIVIDQKVTAVRAYIRHTVDPVCMIPREQQWFVEDSRQQGYRMTTSLFPDTVRIADQLPGAGKDPFLRFVEVLFRSVEFSGKRFSLADIGINEEVGHGAKYKMQNA